MKTLRLRSCVRNRQFSKVLFAYGHSVKKATMLEHQAVCQGTHLQHVPILSITMSGSYSTWWLSCSGGKDVSTAGVP